MPLFMSMDNPTIKQLKRLRKILRDLPAHKPAAAPESPPPSDHELFIQAVKGARPLKPERYQHPKHSPSPWPRPHRPEEMRAIAETMTDFWPWDELEFGEELMFMRPGIQHEAVRKLRRGEWITQAELDLHGHTSDSARLAVVDFLHHCRLSGLRCVRIVHGKGLSSRNHEPVLKLKLKNWLAQREDVLAFCQARPAEGGGGAALVLLKAQREK